MYACVAGLLALLLLLFCGTARSRSLPTRNASVPGIDGWSPGTATFNETSGALPGQGAPSSPYPSLDPGRSISGDASSGRAGTAPPESPDRLRASQPTFPDERRAEDVSALENAIGSSADEEKNGLLGVVALLPSSLPSLFSSEPTTPTTPTTPMTPTTTRTTPRRTEATSEGAITSESTVSHRSSSASPGRASSIDDTAYSIPEVTTEGAAAAAAAAIAASVATASSRDSTDSSSTATYLLEFVGWSGEGDATAPRYEQSFSSSLPPSPPPALPSPTTTTTTTTTTRDSPTEEPSREENEETATATATATESTDAGETSTIEGGADETLLATEATTSVRDTTDGVTFVTEATTINDEEREAVSTSPPFQDRRGATSFTEEGTTDGETEAAAATTAEAPLPTETENGRNEDAGTTESSEGGPPIDRDSSTEALVEAVASPNDRSTEDRDTTRESSTREGTPALGEEGSTPPAVPPSEPTTLVRVTFEGGWPEVCPHLPALRRSLGDLLAVSLKRNVPADRIVFRENPCDSKDARSIKKETAGTPNLLLYVVDKDGNSDAETTKLVPRLFRETTRPASDPPPRITIRSFRLVQEPTSSDSSNAVAVIVVSCVALVCLAILAVLLLVVTSGRTRFNYGERCRPVSLDAYSLDSVSAYSGGGGGGAARAARGGGGSDGKALDAAAATALRLSKRSYGNPGFEDSTATPSHPLNLAGLSLIRKDRERTAAEFAGIPRVVARIDDSPAGAETKNRYANVIALPETRVPLARINDDPLSEYTNASYVRGPKNATKYYIACQAPLESTVPDFWRMIWEQRSKVVIMLTDLVENGVERCAEYVPPCEVTDRRRLYGDFQVTLRKRETKDKYAVSSVRLKNLERDAFRDVSHVWYPWPSRDEEPSKRAEIAGTLIAVLLEARALQRGGPAPIVVHCSPGTGRTGTLIALDLAVRQYEITRTVDVPRVVRTIRRDRAGAVRTNEQYAVIYEALYLYASRLAGGTPDS